MVEIQESAGLEKNALQQILKVLSHYQA